MNQQSQTATLKELRSVLFRWTIVLAVVGLFVLWATWRMTNVANRLSVVDSPSQLSSATAEPQIEYWTCTMHPEVRQPGPGECPICGMKLVEKFAGSDEPGVKPAAPIHQEGMAHSDHEQNQRLPAESESAAWYRCTMPECGDQGSSDPNSRCPVCGMKRERVEMGGVGAGTAEIRLNERAQRLAEVETEPVQQRLLFKRIRTVGRVSHDETRFKMVSAWIGGRIDKLFADFTGMTVSRGDHLVEIYSPELLSAQEEYLLAVRAVGSTSATQTEVARRSSEQVLAATRRKLELLGVTDAQFATIEQSGQPQTHLVVYAPLGGTILAKQAMEGMYVKTGDPLYTIADLQHLWLLVDLYESDLPWVKPFQQVTVTTRSLPGEAFTGEIFFVDPKVDPKSRTVEVRIHVDNASLQLKPDMWVEAQIDAGLNQSGRGAIPHPGGEYACPMHTWQTADRAATCALCEMDMVPVESLPAYSAPTEPVPLLSVPRDAVMQTGERSLVYIESAPGTYRGVAVTIGPLARADDGQDYYSILAGLNGDERVVKRGNFAIDSQFQLAGKPSLFATRGVAQPGAGNQEPHSDATPAQSPASADRRVQTHCPVMGNEIDREVHVDYKGVRIYFCCPPCIKKFEADPEKYVSALPTAMQEKLRHSSAKESGHD